ncbi:fungal hydrophobin [Polyporus arcularius HHB13444]|uniref:Hydrophobin n=2 Tax=Polyporaceae TaxID=5317 RepID=A0A5C3NPX9_9APHY|nr:fungal hydrophobin [Polyporus brumalis]TFK79365.1 fungal hydrophobin [Polyporus arcularius HHB13444]
MFARAATFSLLALPLLAAATPLRRGSCNTGEVQCCNSVHETNESAISVLLGLVGVDVGSITGQVGLQCSGLSAVGVGSNSCSSNTVCCQNNNVGGLISIGCAPIFL